MRWLIGCECSGTIRRALRAHGHDAWSCDLKPATDNSPYHFHGDLRQVLHHGWDAAIFHPDCTYLTIAAEWAYGPGPYHQRVKPGTLTGASRLAARADALAFVKDLLSAPIPCIALENPVGVIGTRVRPADQTIQPWQFGDDASKGTCLWLKGLPALRPTVHATPRSVDKPGGIGRRYRFANQTDAGQNRLPPSDDRAAERAVTYPGIAAAIADQWGDLDFSGHAQQLAMVI